MQDSSLPNSLVEVLRRRALTHPERCAYRFLDGELAETGRLTYGELEERARALGSLLRERGMKGERAVLFFPPGLDFVTAFLGCLYGGVVAVPAYPPGSRRSLSRMAAVLEDCQPRMALTSAAVYAKVERMLDDSPALRRIEWVVTDGIGAAATAGTADWRHDLPEPGDLAFLQYTSGSTSTPKGVMVSHGNLVHNERMIQRAFRQSEGSVVVGWLPLYHDMGLIGTVLQPLFTGAECLLMSPLAFLQKPVRWLEAISRHRATTSGGPNFAYDLCVRKVSREDMERLDLSCWETAFNGAEPVRAETLDRFARHFAPCGFRREAFRPCYGLAEATLLVTGERDAGGPVVADLSAAALAQGRVSEAAEEGKAASLVSSGRPALGQRVAVVDPETGVECAPDRVGEIWVAGPSLAAGYWRRPEVTERTFGARLPGGEGPFLRTGDLGFVRGGEVFITGRLKDLIILRGRNLYPQDVERTVEESHPALRPGCGAAFSLEVDGEERLVVVQEVEPRAQEPLEGVAAEVRRAVAEEHEAQLHRLVLVRAGAVPKTTSGKVQRQACRQALLANALEVLWSSAAESEPPMTPRVAEGIALDREALLALPRDERREPLAAALRQRTARVLRVPAGRLETAAPLTAMGLDSLAAIEIKNEVETALDASVSLPDLLSGLSLDGLAEHLLEELEAAPRPRRMTQEAAGEGGDLPLSYGQRALWFLDRLAPEAAALNLAGAAVVRSGLDVEALRRALNALADRHAALRTVFVAPQGEPVQRVLPALEPDFARLDASGWNADLLRRRLHEEAYRPFDLERGPLLRVRVFERPDGEAVLLLAIHHLVADFASVGNLIRELAVLLRDDAPVLPALTASHAGYVRSEEETLAGPEGERLWAYWQRQLGGELPALDFPADRPRPARQTFHGAAEGLRLGSELTASLRRLGSDHGVTLYTTLLAAFQALLHRYTGQEDLVVGSPTWGRSSAGQAGLVGYFVNPVALRGDLTGDPTGAGLLARTRGTVLAAFAHQGFPFALLAQRLQPVRDPSRPPLFQMLFSLQGGGSADPGLAGFALGEAGVRLEAGPLSLESLRLEERRAQLDMTLMAAELDGELALSLEYNTGLFDAATARRVLGHWRTLLAGMAGEPERRLSLLPLLTPEERRQTLSDWNGPSPTDIPADRCVHELFAEQAGRVPDTVAVSFGDEHVTYRELRSRASRLARHLRGLGVRPETRVAVCADRSPGLLAALLGVLEAGGAYVPLDPGYPLDRLELVMRDSGAAVLLGSRAPLERLAVAGLPGGLPEGTRVVRLEEVPAEPAAPLPATGSEAGHLAYVLYTSGSTGRPKGVEVTHRSLVNFLASMARTPGLGVDDVLLAVTTLSFDIAGLELYLPLITGARVALASRETAGDGVRLLAEIGRSGATVLQATPATWRMLLQAGWDGSPALRVLCGGEALPVDLATALARRSSSVWNLYGPTETTVWSSVDRVRDEANEAVTLGRPIAHTSLYVLDPALEPVPAGVAGELYIGGRGVARGYLGRPDLTAERFVPDLFATEPGARLYRTGDLVSVSAAGRLHFLGRLDHQVKVRGFRIELGEVEAALTRLPGVREAVVVARPDAAVVGSSRLVAYVAAPAGSGLDAAGLRRALRQSLPEYMVPAAFVLLEELPRTPNNKIDRRSLPEPEARPVDLVAPRGPLEELVAGIWADILGLDEVGAGDDFFELGGHSLLVTQVVSRLRDALGRELPVAALFEAPTVARLAARLEEETGTASLPPVTRVGRREGMPLSFAQQRLWFLDQLEPGSVLYNMPHALRLSGRLRPELLEWSLGEVVRRHEILRTTFRARAGEPEQIVAASLGVALPLVDLAGLPAAARETELTVLIAGEARRPFDLAAGPLLRVRLVRLDEAEHALLLDLHHIVSDGWSMGVVEREVRALYTGEAAGRPSPLPELAAQYADYAAWQRRWLSGDALEPQLAYWRERLAGLPALLELPTDRPRPAVQSLRGASRSFALGGALTASLRTLGRGEGATPFMVLLAGLQLLLGRYSGSPDVSVGTPVAGRNRTELEGLIGFFANTLVLRGDLAGEPGFRELLARTRTRVLEAHARQDVPFERLVEELAPERSLAHSPLFQVMLVPQEVPREIRSSEWGADLRIRPLDVGTGTAKFDLLFAFTEAGGGIEGTIEYATDLFDASRIERLGRHLVHLLESASRDLERPAGTLPLLSAAERHQLLGEWAGGPPVAGAAGAGERLHALFATQARRTPDAVAVVSGEQSLTYGELGRRARRLATRLASLGASVDARIGLLARRSPEMVAGLLGILETGAACVPLDPAYPRERLRLMLEDAAVAVVLAPHGLAAELGLSGEVVDLEPAAPAASGSGPLTENLSGTAGHGESLAYVIYTSGSTGRPKGVAMPHRPLVHLMAWQDAALPGAATTLQFAPLSFDVSFQEMFSTWGAGGRLVLVAEEVRLDPHLLLDLLESEGVERLFLPFVALQSLAEAAERRVTVPAALREIVTAGEQLRVTRQVAGWLARCPGSSLHNHYGPSESHVVTAEELRGDPASWPALPTIGRPVAGAHIHLAGPLGEPVPAGVNGELYIGGPALARGYLGRPELTAERFVPDPFAGEPGGRLYRSGDLARWLPDGRVEFLGRIDAQVKIRGFRIEPGEVETVLGTHPAVQAVAVVVRQRPAGDRHLVAYVVLAGSVEPEELRDFLRGRLPEYMVPSAVVELEVLPRTPSGKVDRRALPEPFWAEAEPEGPLTPVEERLGGIWSEVLGVERIGPRSDFFSLGGHSLLATRVTSRIEDAFGIELPLRRLFERPVLADLAATIEEVLSSQAATLGPRRIGRRPQDGPARLSSAQQRLWFLDRLESGCAAYNMPAAVSLEGDLDEAALWSAFEEVVRRHEPLRTTFGELGGEPVQVISASSHVPPRRVDLGGLAETARVAEWRRLMQEEAARPFDLMHGPLLRAVLVRLSATEHLLLLTLHHIVSDGWSMGVLVTELGSAYEAFLRGETPALPELPVQYADFAHWQRDWLRGGELETQLAFWKRHLAGAPELELPTDRPRPAVRSSRGGREAAGLAGALARELEALAQSQGSTLFMVLLAGFSALLSRYTGQEDLVVGSPVANRGRTELEGLIGFFVNTLALRVDLSGRPTFRELLGRVREVTLEAQAHQDVPFEKLVEELAPERRLDRNPLFQVMLAVQSTPLPELALPGLALRLLDLDTGLAKFDLNLAFEDPRSLEGWLEFNADLFDRTTAGRMTGHLRTLLAGAVADPGRRLAELPLLTGTEREQLVVEWNATAADYPGEPCLHQLVAAQAARTPDAAAVTFEGHWLSYGELERRANRLAYRLRLAGVGPETLVAVCAERSLEMIEGLLAVLAAGGAWVPLDPAHPRERLAFMLRDAGVPVLLTQQRWLASLPPFDGLVIRLDAEEETTGLDGTAPASGVTGAHLAYTIYTSGSTGLPKGAMNTHRGIRNRLLWMQDSYGLGADERVLQKTPFTFDVSVWEMFCPLIAGGLLVMARPGGHQDGGYLSRLIAEQGITTLHFVPSMLRVFLEERGLEQLESVRRVVCSGEALAFDLQERFFSRFAASLHNFYGPTETSVEVTWWDCERDGERRFVPIGRPVANLQAYVLDGSLNSVPVGVPGGLYIGGMGVGRGYLGRPALTGERFLPDPFSGEPGSRLYETGDVVRYRPEGELEYLGRADFQVKIRGLRIELGEIESALSGHPAVREAVVTAREEASGPRLVGYLVARPGMETPAAEELRRHLEGTLPAYMVPSVFVPLDALPLTSSGKVDRNALPEPARVEEPEPEGLLTPLTPVAERLAGIWSEVLDVERIGPRSDFFSLGGHSLLATRVISRIQDAFGVELPLRRLFERPGLAGLAGAIEEALAGQTVAGRSRIGRRPQDGPARLSSAQHRLWFLDRLEPGSAAYNMPAAVSLEGALDEAALWRAFEEVVRRHESLRTTFGELGGEPVQVISESAAAPRRRVDLSGLSETARTAEWRRLMQEEAARPFDLVRGPLLRAALVRLSATEHLLLLTLHHIVSDGWSMGVLVTELGSAYAAFLRGETPVLPELPIQYADFAHWQRDWLAGGELETQLAFWKRHLAGAPELELPTDRPRPAVRSSRGGREAAGLAGALARELEALAQSQGSTLFMVLLAGFSALLSRYTGQEDLVVGSPVANRGCTELEGLIGFFVNTLALRVDLSGRPAFRELLGRVREVTLEAQAHQDVPFEKLVEELAPERRLDRNPLFQVMLAVQSTPMPELALPGLALRLLDLDTGLAKFDLNLAFEDPRSLEGWLEFNADLFDHTTAGRMTGHLRTLLTGAVADPGRCLAELPLLTGTEREQLLVEWNATAAGYPGEPCLHQLVAAQAARTPDAVAVTFEEHWLSHGELSRRSNRLAHRLRRAGVGPETLVAVCAERSLEMIEGLLAVLAAGGAWVPLDPAHPRERLAFMLRDAGVPVLLTQERWLANLPPFDGLVIRLDAEAESAGLDGTAPASGVTGAHLAYTIYTSGSTGLPKGAMNTHRGIRNRLLWMQDSYGLGADERVLQKTPFTFDVSVWEMFCPLIAGGLLVMARPGGHQESGYLARVIAEQGITTLHFVPSMLRVFLEERGLEDLESVRRVVCSGEALAFDLQERFFSRFAASLHNFYGPTETSVEVTWWDCERDGQRHFVPIGRPVANLQAYVLDGSLNPVPVGVPGGLYIGGVGVGRGYLGRPALTGERFLPDPFSRESGSRLYETGDVVRYRPEGELEYLGRADFQVKIRGLRIELGEIESALSGHPAVREAVVTAREEASGLRLVGYLVARPGMEAPAAEELRRHLEGTLPAYMVPSVFLALDALPLTSSGKVDRKALPEPARGEGSEPEGPLTPVEERLAGIWSEVLDVERIGPRSDFFSLGGHSLLATRVISRIQDAFGIDLPLRRLFERPGLASLAATIEESLARQTVAGRSRIGRRPQDGPARLSSAQQRLWFLDRLEPGSAAYNMPAAVSLEGDLDESALWRAFEEVVRRHESLRTTFGEAGGEPVQVISGSMPVARRRADLSGLSETARTAEWRRLMQEEAARPFDLVRGPLLRAVLVQLSEAEHLLLLTLHHIVSDGWSMGVLVTELGAAYGAFLRGGTPALPELPIQYADFAHWQRDWLAGDELETQLAFWTRHLADTPELDLPTDRPRPAVRSPRGGREAAGLAGSLARELEALARSEGSTLFMALLAGFSALLSRYTGQEDLVVGSPVANRGRTELEGLIGFFVNTLALRVDLSGRPTFRELLGRVREVTLEAQAHQDVPFEKLVEQLAPERRLDRNPLFQVMLAVQSTPLPELVLPGLALRLLDLDTGLAKFDLNLDLDATRPGLPGSLEYATDLFDRTTVTRLALHLERLLAGAVAEPDRRLEDLPLLVAAERHQILREWQDEQSGPALCLHRLFEAQVRRTPHASAVEQGGEALSYLELNGRANRIARRLRSLGAVPETVVGIFLERSPDLVAALLGVLKAGAAYLPLVPGTPVDRLSFFLEDSSAAALLTEERLLGALPGLDIPVLCLDRIPPGDGEANLTLDGSPESLAYVIYTSGSQGTPKGVSIQHASLVNYVTAATEAHGLGRGDRMLQFASVSFDASAEEIYPTLLSGATLVLRDEEMIGSPERFLRACRTLGITVLDLPTAYFHELAASLAVEEIEVPSTLRLMILGGEKLQSERLVTWSQAAPAVRVVNTYGPTEGTIVATQFALPAGEEWTGEVPIGRPVRGVQALVLGPDLLPVPVGAPGELALGGAGLARGYLGRPSLTAGQFVPRPGAHHPGERLYRTGDRVRQRPDGLLEFLGRIDDQVKIRGFRVEPGEVESLLARHPEVAAAAVLVAEPRPGDRRLVAYVASRPGRPLDAEGLRTFLRRSLPDYMVPAAFVSLAALPLTPHGKVDRRKLARILPEEQAAGAGRFQSPVEELLAGIWMEVLGIGSVGPHDDFFALGGHSLLATQLVSRVRRAFGVEPMLRSVFESPTVAGLALHLEELLAASPALQAPPLEPAVRGAESPLSFAQERLWFLDQLAPGDPSYNLPAAVQLAGDLDVAALEGALREITRRHESLRTTFAEAGGQPVQRIGGTGHDFSLPVIDLGAHPEDGRWAEVTRLALAEARRSFDLARGPLLSARLLRLASAEHVLLWNLHHIVSDGWSTGVLLREIAALYGAFVHGEASPLPELPVQYADFALWQRRWFQGEVLEQQTAYWREALAGAPAVLDLPFDRPRPAVRSGRGEMLPLELPHGLAETLQALGRREGVTPFMVLLAAFQTLLQRWTGQTDLPVGTPVANRNRLEVEELIGFFVNTLVLRADLGGDLSFLDLLARVREVVLSAHAHQDLPFEKLVEALAPERNLSHSPLFQVMFILQNAPLPDLDLPGLEVRLLEMERGISKFDLTLAFEDPRRLAGGLEFDTDLFDRATAARMAGHLRTLLAGAVADPGRRLAELPLLTGTEREQLVVEWNATAADYPGEPCLHELVAARAVRTPDAAAVTFEGHWLSYGELERRSNRLAHRLRRAGVGPETLVAVCAERSLEMIEGLLAVLAAGGAWVPLDPAHPRERLAFMLRDAGVSVLLTQERWLANLPPFDGLVIRLDAEAETAGFDPTAPASGVTGAHLAYTIYTSGSTGLPKGAMNTHRGIRNRLLWMQESYGLGADERVLQKTPFTFDVSVWEMFCPLIAGGLLVMARPGGHQDGGYLARLIAEQGITTLHFVPSMLRVFLEERGLEDLESVRRVVCSGEALAFDLQERFFSRFAASLHNFYGPTETSVEVTWWDCERDGQRRFVPIGRPVANLQAYVLDGSLNPVPVGVSGGLYIGGVGVGRGYLGRPALTAERFLPDPFSREPGSRLYETGDVVRYRPEGELEYLGRADFQVKIRGLRIELGEIESALSGHPAVREAVVTASEEASGLRLVAYLVARPGMEVPAAEELRHHLEGTLPAYMMPSVFLALDALPMTSSGKVDRKALPEPSGVRLEAERTFVSPRSPVEQQLAEIWRETLKVERVGLHDNFFELGGHSLLATQVVSRVRAAFHLEDLPLRSLFQEPTLERLALAVTQMQLEQEDDQEMARMIAELQAMSADDLEELLRAEQAEESLVP